MVSKDVLPIFRFLIFSLVLALHSVIIIPVLVHFGNEISHEVENQGMVVPSDLSCVECCLRREKSECSHCNSSQLPCNFEPGESRSEARHFSESEIGKIVEDVLLNHDVDESFENEMRQSHKDHGVLLERWQKINQYVLSPRLPYAHLMADGPPHKEGNNKYIMRSWEWRRGAKFAHVSHESMYQNGSAILVVPQAGLYNVYIHTTFYAFGQAEEEWCTLSHEVLRNGRSLIKSSERRKCQYVLGPRKRRLEGFTPRGLETLDSAGAFQFAKGERLSVHYRMPNNMRVGSTDTETYFGIFML